MGGVCTDPIAIGQLLSLRWEASRYIKYATFQLERGKEGTLHLQGYMELRTKMEGHNVEKEIFSDQGVHMEARKGSQKQAIAYCNKEETRVAGPWTVGKLVGQGKRTDIEAFCEKLEKGTPMDQCAQEDKTTYMKYHAGLEKYHEITRKHRDPNLKPRVMIFVGKPGAGKTRDATKLLKDLYGENECYTKSAGNKWFADYRGQKGVILDEYTGGTLPLCQLLQLLDRGQPFVEQKGHSTRFDAETIILTSNYPPKQWYQDALGIQLNALYRRFDVVRIYHNTDKYTMWESDGTLDWRDGSLMRAMMAQHYERLMDTIRPMGAPFQSSDPNWQGTSGRHMPIPTVLDVTAIPVVECTSEPEPPSTQPDRTESPTGIVDLE